MPVNLCFQLEDVLLWRRRWLRPEETERGDDEIVLNPGDAADPTRVELVGIVRD